MKDKDVTGRKRNPAAAFLEIMLLIGMPVLCHFLCPLVELVTGFWRLSGIIPMILGLALANSGAAEFRKEKTGFQLETGSSALVTSGPFRFSRNPIYLGMIIWLGGMAVLLGSLTAFLFPVIFFVLANFLFIPPEEKKLERTFGDQYISYRRRVRRWL